jgi:MFS family permease
MLTLLVAIYASSSLDRLIIAALGPALKRDLLISDTQFGLLGGILFMFVYTAGGIPIARLAERFNRVWIISAALAIWSAFTALCALATSFAHLLLLRMGVGLGESGCAPTCYSLLSDQYPPRARASAVAILGLGVPIGSAAGAFLGGWASDVLSWQAAFVIAGVPGLVLALIVLLGLREPPRGTFDPAGRRSEDVPPLLEVLKRIGGKPAFMHLTMLAALAIFCNLGLNLFIPAFFVRSFGLSFSEAGAYFGLITGLAAAFGTTVLGLGIARLAKGDSRWYGWGPGLLMILGAPVYIAGLLQADFQIALLLLMISSPIGFAFLGPAVGATQNMMDPRMRASAAALFLFVMNMVGGGLGPVFTGQVSDWLASRAFAGDFAATCPGGAAPAGAGADLAAACAAAAEHGLRYALVGCALFFVWGGIHALLATRTMRRDLGEQDLTPTMQEATA